MVTEQSKDDLLEALYRRDCTTTISFPLGRLEHDLPQWDHCTIRETAKALEADHLIRLRDPYEGMVFTLDGYHLMEKRFNPSPTFTQNIVTANTITNAPIQQGGAHATMTQSVNYTQEDSNDLRRLVEVFEKHIDELALDATAKRKATAQVATIKAQLEDEPNLVIVKQAGSTLRSITEKVITDLIVAATTNPTVWTQIQAIMSKLF